MERINARLTCNGGAVKREMRRIELDKYRKWTLLFSDAFLKGLDCVEEALLIR